MRLRLVSGIRQKRNKKTFITDVVVKACINICRNKMFEILRKLGSRLKFTDRRIIYDFHKDQVVLMRVDIQKRQVLIMKKVRQGCLSTSLFMMYIEKTMKEIDF